MTGPGQRRLNPVRDLDVCLIGLPLNLADSSRTELTAAEERQSNCHVGLVLTRLVAPQSTLAHISNHSVKAMIARQLGDETLCSIERLDS